MAGHDCSRCYVIPIPIHRQIVRQLDYIGVSNFLAWNRGLMRMLAVRIGENTSVN